MDQIALPRQSLRLLRIRDVSGDQAQPDQRRHRCRAAHATAVVATRTGHTGTARAMRVTARVARRIIRRRVIPVVVIRRVRIRREIRMRHLEAVIHDPHANARAEIAVPHARHIRVDARHARSLARVAQMPLITRVRGVVGKQRVIRDQPALLNPRQQRLRAHHTRQRAQGIQHQQRIARAAQRENVLPRRERRLLHRNGPDQRLRGLRIKHRRRLHQHLTRQNAPRRLTARFARFIQHDVLLPARRCFRVTRGLTHFAEVAAFFRRLGALLTAGGRFFREFIHRHFKTALPPAIADFKRRA